MIRTSEGSFIGVDGLRLAYHAWEPAVARAALVVVHGIGEHSGRYADFGRKLAAGGIATFAADQRGHGLSEGRRGHVRAFDQFLQDTDRFRREVEGGIADGGIPLFLLGHSMGGLIALRYLQEYPGQYAGTIIVSPWLATVTPMSRIKAGAAAVLARIAPALPLRTGLDPDDLSRHPAVAEAYRADPLVHDRITPRMFAEVTDAIGTALQRGDRLQLPMLFMLAGDDRIVDTGRSARFARSLTAPDTTVRVFPGAFHELLNEIDREDMHRMVRDWILSRV